LERTRVKEPKRPRPAAADDPAEIKRPVVAVQVGDRLGILALTRRASEVDRVVVKWDDTAETSEVASREVRVLRVDDARRYEPINRGLTTSELSDEA